MNKSKDLYFMSDSVAMAYKLWDAKKNKKAFQLFFEAANRKEKLAYNTLAYFYDHGIGVKKTPAQALYWYRRAALVGDISAFYNIGLCYLRVKNFRLARIWFNKAAAKGNVAAAQALVNLDS